MAMMARPSNPHHLLPVIEEEDIEISDVSDASTRTSDEQLKEILHQTRERIRRQMQERVKEIISSKKNLSPSELTEILQEARERIEYQVHQQQQQILGNKKRYITQYSNTQRNNSVTGEGNKIKSNDGVKKYTTMSNENNHNSNTERNRVKEGIKMKNGAIKKYLTISKENQKTKDNNWLRNWNVVLSRDPLLQILEYMNDMQQEGISGSESIFTAWQLPSLQPGNFSPMMFRGSNDRNRQGQESDGCWGLDGFVPFLQINTNGDKDHVPIETLAKDGKVRLFFKYRKSQREVGQYLRLLSEYVLAPWKTRRRHLIDESDEACRIEILNDMKQMKWHGMEKMKIQYIDDYATSCCYGLEIPLLLFWEAYVIRQDLAKQSRSEYFMDHGSQPKNQYMNLAALVEYNNASPRAVKQQQFFQQQQQQQHQNHPHYHIPQPVLFQNAGPDDPLNPFDLVMAYEVDNKVTPITLNFECFILGTHNNVDVQEERRTGAPVESGNNPPVRLGLGDANSTSIAEKVSGNSHDVDTEYLVIAGGLRGNVSWNIIESGTLPDVLNYKIDEGYFFPFNPELNPVASENDQEEVINDDQEAIDNEEGAIEIETNSCNSIDNQNSQDDSIGDDESSQDSDDSPRESEIGDSIHSWQLDESAEFHDARRMMSPPRGLSPRGLSPRESSGEILEHIEGMHNKVKSRSVNAIPEEVCVESSSSSGEMSNFRVFIEILYLVLDFLTVFVVGFGRMLEWLIGIEHERIEEVNEDGSKASKKSTSGVESTLLIGMVCLSLAFLTFSVGRGLGRMAWQETVSVCEIPQGQEQPLWAGYVCPVLGIERPPPPPPPPAPPLRVLLPLLPERVFETIGIDTIYLPFTSEELYAKVTEVANTAKVMLLNLIPTQQQVVQALLKGLHLTKQFVVYVCKQLVNVWRHRQEIYQRFLDARDMVLAIPENVAQTANDVRTILADLRTQGLLRYKIIHTILAQKVAYVTQTVNDVKMILEDLLTQALLRYQIIRTILVQAATYAIGVLSNAYYNIVYPYRFFINFICQD